jgi:hypothetical protein
VSICFPLGNYPGLDSSGCRPIMDGMTPRA